MRLWRGTRRAVLLAGVVALAGCAGAPQLHAPLALDAEPVAAAATAAKGQETAFAPPAFLEQWQQKMERALARRGPDLKQQARLGEQLAARILKQAKLAQDAAMRQRLERIIARLKKAADAIYPVQWKLHLLDGKRADAFTTGGGHLFITTGMVKLLERDERIATVLAHEMAHDLMGHVLLARDKKELARRAQAFSRKVLAEDLKLDWLSRSMNFIVLASLNTYSRQQEHEADAEGLYLMVRAGYAPQVVLETFDFLRRHFRDQPALQNFFYGMHPNYSSRRWRLDNIIRAHYRREAGLPRVRRGNWRRAPQAGDQQQ